MRAFGINFKLKTEHELNICNLGSRMTAFEIAQASLETKVSTIQKDTSDRNFMMTEIYQAFKGPLRQQLQ